MSSEGTSVHDSLFMGEVIDRFFTLDQEEQHGSIRILGDLLIANSRSLGLRDHPDQHFKVLVTYADSLYSDLQHRRALHFYKESLQVLTQMKHCEISTTIKPLPTECDVKWKMYKCHKQLKENQEALDVLSSISLRQRNSKVALALAKLYHHFKNDSRSAIICYKQAVSMVPLALEAVIGLLSLGVTLSEVILLSRPRGGGGEGSGVLGSGSWLYEWLEVQACIARNEYHGAVSKLEALTGQGFRLSADTNCQLARCLVKLGKTDAAKETFATAHAQDPYALTHMDTYSRLLTSKPHLERLSATLLYASCSHPEPWVAKAWHLTRSDNLRPAERSKANIFVQKANSIAPKNAEAAFFQGSLLMSKKELTGAVKKFSEAVHIDPTFCIAFESLIRCYTIMRYDKEAVNIVRTAARHLPQAKKCFLEGLALSQHHPAKAKLVLEQSIKLDHTFDRAVTKLASLYTKEDSFGKATEILSNHLKLFTSPVLHSELARCLIKLGRYPEAMEQYRHALRLDNCCEKARQGLRHLGRMQSDPENPFTDSRDSLGLNLDEDDGQNIGSDDSAPVLDLSAQHYNEWM